MSLQQRFGLADILFLHQGGKRGNQLGRLRTGARFSRGGCSGEINKDINKYGDFKIQSVRENMGYGLIWLISCVLVAEILNSLHC